MLVALGALFGIYLYSGSNGILGTIINSFLLGMTGVFAYAVPVLFVLQLAAVVYFLESLLG